MMKEIKFWFELITTITAITAIVVSIFALCQTQNESYLSHRAYVGPIIWNTSDANNQFQISFTNSGDTPATNFQVIGRLIVNDMVISSTTLAEGQILLPGLGDINPKVPFDFLTTDINKVMRSDGYVQVEFSYTDYLNRLHLQRTNFKVFNISNKYQIQPIKQIIIK